MSHKTTKTKLLQDIRSDLSRIVDSLFGSSKESTECCHACDSCLHEEETMQAEETTYIETSCNCPVCTTKV